MPSFQNYSVNTLAGTSNTQGTDTTVEGKITDEANPPNIIADLTGNNAVHMQFPAWLSQEQISTIMHDMGVAQFLLLAKANL